MLLFSLSSSLAGKRKREERIGKRKEKERGKNRKEERERERKRERKRKEKERGKREKRNKRLASFVIRIITTESKKVEREREKVGCNYTFSFVK